jgi:hypothetical protein
MPGNESSHRVDGAFQKQTEEAGLLARYGFILPFLCDAIISIALHHNHAYIALIERP